MSEDKTVESFDREIAKRTAERDVASNQESIRVIDDEIKRLQGRRENYLRCIAEAELIRDGIDPCRKCNRRVKSPCHDANGYHGDGPWDSLCHEEFGR